MFLQRHAAKMSGDFGQRTGKGDSADRRGSMLYETLCIAFENEGCLALRNGF